MTTAISRSSVRPQQRLSTSTAQRSTRATRTTQVGHSGQSSFGGSTQRTAATRRAVGHSSRSSFESAARTTPGSSTGTLRLGARNEAVKSLQKKLSSAGFNPGRADGTFGPQTQRAVRDFQRSQGLKADGIAGRRTFSALDGGSRTTGANTTSGATTRGGVDGTARLTNQPRGKGMTTGTITVNGNTYQFNSGGRTKFSTPQGTYRVTAHMNSRSDRGFVRDGVGFSFRMEDPRRPGSDRFYDSRAGRDRTALRIHPDGGAAGTSGCIGIVGNAATLRQFRADMNAELRRNGGSYTLRVQ